MREQTRGRPLHPGAILSAVLALLFVWAGAAPAQQQGAAPQPESEDTISVLVHEDGIQVPDSATTGTAHLLIRNDSDRQRNLEILGSIGEPGFDEDELPPPREEIIFEALGPDELSISVGPLDPGETKTVTLELFEGVYSFDDPDAPEDERTASVMIVTRASETATSLR